MHMLLGSINKMVLINSLLWPRVLATLWSAVLFEIMCARKQIHCRGMTALSSTPPLRMLFLYPAETQHLRLTWLDLFRNNLLLCCLVLAWHPGGKKQTKKTTVTLSADSSPCALTFLLLCHLYHSINILSASVYVPRLRVTPLSVWQMGD